ncbi:MAG TPA: adenylate kinase [Myxococcales bacterium]|nr:adenylate kinase [Myxococcales bacterium]
MYLIFLGAPGAGKGTQAKALCQDLGVPHISTGDMLRAAQANGSKLGREINEIMKSGSLVSDTIVLDLIKERLKGNDAANGAIFDGFPRTLAQAEGLSHFPNLSLSHVISLDVQEDRSVKRLTGRRTCKGCGAMFHVEFRPSVTDGICDACGSELYQREDDNDSSIRNRLAVYHNNTAPLICYYSEKGLLREVCASGTPAEVTVRIKTVLGV